MQIPLIAHANANDDFFFTMGVALAVGIVVAIVVVVVRRTGEKGGQNCFLL